MHRQILLSSGSAGFKVDWRGRGVVGATRKEFDTLTKRPFYGMAPSPVERLIRGWKVDVDRDCRQIILLPKKNLVVTAGVDRSLDRLFAINSTPAALTRIGVDNGTTNPIGASVSSDAGSGSDTGSSSQTLRTFDSTPTRTLRVVTAPGTFNDVTTAGIGAVGFIMGRLFLSAHTANITNTTSADASGSLYSMTNAFTINFTSITTWVLVFSATVTGAGT